MKVWITIELDQRSRKQIAVEAQMHAGGLAVTPSQHKEGRLTITHIATGTMVADNLTEKMVVRRFHRVVNLLDWTQDSPIITSAAVDEALGRRKPKRITTCRAGESAKRVTP